MSNASAVSLCIEPRPSRYLAVLLVTAHGAAVAVLWQLSWPLWVTLPLGLLVGVSFVFQWRYHVLRRGPRVVLAATWSAAGRWSLETAGEVISPVFLRRCGFVHHALVILRFEVPGRRRDLYLVLFADALDPQVHRRLRARLLQAAGTVSGIVSGDR